MEKIKVLVVFGTRPEAIKMAPVIRELKTRPMIETVVCVTAQHREMLDQVLDVFKIVPDIDLNLMQPNQTLASLTTVIMTEFTRVLDRISPHMVLVHGDTTSSSIAALAAFYKRIKIGHVEAGLRTYDKDAPWPEEVNRRITGVCADLHFAPTQESKDNLLSEKIAEQKIFVTGNTVVDALKTVRANIEADSALRSSLKDRFPFLDPDKRLILVTGHRRENFGKGFQHICDALLRITEAFPDTQIIYPVHLNPNVKDVVFSRIMAAKEDIRNRIHLLEPLDYLGFVYLLMNSYFVLTDSGGIQEEAPSFGKPVLVMRSVTERPEGVKAGAVRLVGTEADSIYAAAHDVLQSTSCYRKMAGAGNPYGDGVAAQKIAEVIEKEVLR